MYHDTMRKKSFNSQEENLLGLLSNSTAVLKHDYFLFVSSGFVWLVLFFFNCEVYLIYFSQPCLIIKYATFWGLSLSRFVWLKSPSVVWFHWLI